MYLCTALRKKHFSKRKFLGEVAEWSIAAVLKTVVLRGTRGSNPCLSAIKGVNQVVTRFTPFFTPKNVKLGVFVLFMIIKGEYKSFLPVDAFIGFMCLMFAGGIAYAIYHALFIAVVQQNIASEILGRTFSLIFSLSTLSSLLGILVSGYLAENMSIATLFVICGTLIGAVGVAACFISSIKSLQ